SIRPVEREVRMATAVLLVLLGALSRLIPHPPNFAPLGALALYAGARLPRRFAWVIPIAALVVSDFAIDFGSGRAALSWERATIYATCAAIVFAGRRLRENASLGRLAAFSVGASILFFLTSNFAMWASGTVYAKTAAGLALCFTLALPFFPATLSADLAGVT